MARLHYGADEDQVSEVLLGALSNRIQAESDLLVLVIRCPAFYVRPAVRGDRVSNDAVGERRAGQYRQNVIIRLGDRLDSVTRVSRIEASLHSIQNGAAQ